MSQRRRTVLLLLLLAGVFAANACGRATSAPVNTLRAACTAAQKRDVVAYKQAFSRHRLAGMSELAQQNNMRPDELLRKFMEQVSCADTLEVVEEKIVGDRAIVAVKEADSAQLARYQFVREDGAWKFAD